MGSFLKNKNKRIHLNGLDKPNLTNLDPAKSIIGENIVVIDKKSIKTGLGVKKATNKDTTKLINQLSKHGDILPKEKNVNQPQNKLLEQSQEDQVNLITNYKPNSKKNKKYALVTILDNNFAPYFYVFLKSFLENNLWFSGDVVILYNYDLSFISNENIRQIKLLYRNIIFKKIETNRYNHTIKEFKSKVSRNFHRFIPSILTLESFNVIGYDKVLYLDSDMLVIGDISELFKIGANIIATRDTSEYIRLTEVKPINDDSIKLNGGFLLLDGNFIKSRNHVDKMLDVFQNIKEPTFLDQSILNEYLKNFEVCFVSSDFNLLKRCFDDSKSDELKKHLSDIKIIHYVGEKPWMDKQKEFEKNYKAIEKLWFNYYNRYRHISEKIDKITLISSGVSGTELNSIIPKIKDGKFATTNWGFLYNKIIGINYYYCSTIDESLVNKILINNFKPLDLWLVTNNFKKVIEDSKNKAINSIDPFNVMVMRSKHYNSIHKKRLNNKKLPLPTSGVSMLLFFSLLDLNTINIVGYNLYTKKNSDGSYKENGTSKFVNPYEDENKPHTIEFDLNFIIIALNNLIKNKTNINFHKSEIIEEIYNQLIDGSSVGEIVTNIKSKYYE